MQMLLLFSSVALTVAGVLLHQWAGTVFFGSATIVLVLKRMGKLPFRKSARATVQSDDAGLTLMVMRGDRTERTERLAWDSVTDVFAYKKDCFAVDQIRLVVGSDDLKRWIEVAEDDEGYEYLIDQLPKRLAGFPAQEEWWQRVALPPFETKWTRLYSRRPTNEMAAQGE